MHKQKAAYQALCFGVTFRRFHFYPHTHFSETLTAATKGNSVASGAESVLFMIDPFKVNKLAPTIRSRTKPVVLNFLHIVFKIIPHSVWLLEHTLLTRGRQTDSKLARGQEHGCQNHAVEELKK